MLHDTFIEGCTILGDKIAAAIREGFHELSQAWLIDALSPEGFSEAQEEDAEAAERDRVLKLQRGE